MKKLLSLLALPLLAPTLFAVDAANDLILSQRKADNSGNIQRNVAPTARGLFTFDASKIPASTTDLTYATPTLSVPASFVISGAGDVAMNAFGVGGAGDKNVYLNTTAGWGHVGVGQFAATIALPGAPNFFAKQLHIADYAGAGVFVDCVAGTAAFTGRYTGNLPGSPTAVGNGTLIARLDSLGYDGTAYSTDPASIVFRSAQAWTSTAHGTGINFVAIANNTTNSFTALAISHLGQFTSTPQQPASVATTPGTTGGTGLSFTGAAGGNTTIATTGVGGIGSAISLTGGTGGTAAVAVTASTGGAGGGVTISSGAGGASVVTGSGTGTGGNAGTFTLSTGVGGAASTSTGVNLGGTGGSWTFTTGNGGAATNGSTNTGGAAGNITLTTGNGGAGATAAGNSGTLNLVTGTAGSGGTVGSVVFKVGNVQTLAVSGGATATLTGGAGNMTIAAGTGASRTLALQTTTSGSTATTAITLDASQNIITAAGTQVHFTNDTSTSITLNASHDYVTLSNASAVTVNLPALASNQGRVYHVKNVGVGTVTLDPNASENLFSTSAVATFALATGDAVTIVAMPSWWAIY